MTPEKIISVSEIYLDILREAGAIAVRADITKPFNQWTDRERLNHSSYLYQGIIRYIDEDRLGKANRHLGCAQHMSGIALGYSISNGMNMNRP